eukprot:TRINITY_DN48617_c0_g1_i1.p1 TRINITY_DN48617_c0_g1~~TRINITY_DN48617_c0_g1_i1.p1  ORF type:complete len:250 (-),score=62.05 TRINITY_DN48617_c0_g1_i1:8-757(-)
MTSSHVRSHFFRRPGGFLCLVQENLEDFAGDALVSSTNRRLEGTFRRNWWGFIGQRSADVALHTRAGPALLKACRAKATELPFGTVLVTSSVPSLDVDWVLHTCVPSHPAGRGADTRPLPAELSGDYVSEEEALETLRLSYEAVLRAAGDLEVQTLALTALGTGYRGYPQEAAAEIALAALRSDLKIPYLEVRFWARVTFNCWVEHCQALQLESCDEKTIQDELWEGRTLQDWRAERKAAQTAWQCSLM